MIQYLKGRGHIQDSNIATLEEGDDLLEMIGRTANGADTGTQWTRREPIKPMYNWMPTYGQARLAGDSW